MKFMVMFLCAILFISITSKRLQEKKVDPSKMEKPVIVKSKEFFLKTPKSHEEIKNKIRSDLIRSFNLETLEKWLDNLKHQKIEEMTRLDEINNINDIKQMTLQVKKMINQSTNKIDEIIQWIEMKNKKVREITKKIHKLEKNEKVKKNKKKHTIYSKEDEFDRLLH